jgi:dimeric dUTPase (all-alpha-NTP-PPase superfamily)
MIEEMWKDQEEFQLQIFPSFKSLDEQQKIALTKEMLLHITSEFDELLSSMGSWKTHKLRKESPPKISGIVEELVDIVKFVINIALIWGITPEKFATKWREKTLVNKYKLLQEKTLMSLKNKPVAIFDIDGVLNDFPSKWVSFVNSKTGNNFTIEQFLEISKLIPYDKYIQLKHEFFENYSDQVEFTNEARWVLSEIKRKGVSIVLLTSRPISEYKKFYYEMISKLVKSNIPFDALIEDREKGLRIMKDFENVLFFVDDDPYYVDDVKSYGIKTYLYYKPYNMRFKYENIIYVLGDILNEL